MKRLLFGTLLLLMCGCIKFGEDMPPPMPETEYRPVIMSREALNNSIKWSTSRAIVNPGKIYYKDAFIFISDKYKGVHIIDNRDASKPIQVGFITVPGCIDMAVKNNILFADNSTDLVAINLQNIQTGQISVTKRIANVLPEPGPPDGLAIPDIYRAGNRPEKNSVIVSWENK